ADRIEPAPDEHARSRGAAVARLRDHRGGRGAGDRAADRGAGGRGRGLVEEHHERRTLAGAASRPPRARWRRGERPTPARGAGAGTERGGVCVPDRRRRSQADPRGHPPARRQNDDIPRETVRDDVGQQLGDDAHRRGSEGGAPKQSGDRLHGHQGHGPARVAGGPAANLRVSVRAGIVVTGTEVLSGRVRDRNGPWLSERLRELGVDLAYTAIVGDRPDDMGAALRFMADQGMDLILTSGGLGPTADDLTGEVVGRFQGREMVLDPALAQRIADILKRLTARWPNL